MRIAFAEDDQHLRTSVARGLQEAGYAVDLAATGAEMSALLAAGGGGAAYDAVILDVRLPPPDGLAICRALRESGARVPILMLTALDAVEQRISGLDAGADDYLTKPFDFGELLARLRALIRRYNEEPPPQLVVGDLVIDVARRRVRRNDREIVLTAREFAFLLYLARNVGRVVTRAELMTQVWEDDRGSWSNIIDVYASRLRRKLDEGEEAALFTTVRGAGFLLRGGPESDAIRPRKSGARRRDRA